jgi:hypothetical protein
MTQLQMTAAVVQAGSFLLDTPRTLTKLTELTRDARPDIFRLTVNSAELTSVEFQSILNDTSLNKAAT